MKTFLLTFVLVGFVASGLVYAQQETKSTTANTPDKKDESANLLKPTNKVDSWRFEEAEGGKGKLSIDGDWVAFKVTEVTGTDWHVQAVQAGLDLKEGAEYKLTCEIKADVRRMATVNAMIDEDDWHEIGLHEDIYVGTSPQKYEATFQATGVNTKKKNRITLALGTDRGTIYIKDIKLIEVKK